MTNNTEKEDSNVHDGAIPDLASNAIWRSMTLLIKLFFQMLTLVVLSRILPVESFGKLAYAMVFIGFMSMAARFGVTPAIVQKPVISEVFLRAAFMLAILLGLISSIALYFSASLFSNDWETIRLIQLISLIFICYGFGSVAEAQLLWRQGGMSVRSAAPGRRRGRRPPPRTTRRGSRVRSPGTPDHRA